MVDPIKIIRGFYEDPLEHHHDLVKILWDPCHDRSGSCCLTSQLTFCYSYASILAILLMALPKQLRSGMSTTLNPHITRNFACSFIGPSTCLLRTTLLCDLSGLNHVIAPPMLLLLFGSNCFKFRLNPRFKYFINFVQHFSRATQVKKSST